MFLVTLLARSSSPKLPSTTIDSNVWAIGIGPEIKESWPEPRLGIIKDRNIYDTAQVDGKTWKTGDFATLNGEIVPPLLIVD